MYEDVRISDKTTIGNLLFPHIFLNLPVFYSLSKEAEKNV